MRYVDIIFIQDPHEYDEIPTVNDPWPDYDAIIEYLTQWDYGEDDSVLDELPSGQR